MRKKGVSLIVLVITIIVMLVLASAVALSLSNGDVIKSAENAVCKTNLKEVEEIANTAWVEAYSLGIREKTDFVSAIQEAFLEHDINKEDYTIQVDENGVKVTAKNCIDFANPEEPGNNQIDPNWVYAYTYTETDGWSERIKKADVTEEVSGKIVARFYATGEILDGNIYLADEEKTVPAGEAYKLVITGEGDCDLANYSEQIPYAWLSETIEYEAGNIDSFLAAYITEVEIGEGITSVGEMAFCYASNIRSITIPSTVNKIGLMAFYGCTNITTITLPVIQSIGENAFWYTNLATINYKGTEAQYNSIEGLDGAKIPSGVKVNYNY